MCTLPLRPRGGRRGKARRSRGQAAAAAAAGVEPSDAVAVQAARDAAGDAVDAFDVSCVLEDILQKVELFEGLCEPGLLFDDFGSHSACCTHPPPRTAFPCCATRCVDLAWLWARVDDLANRRCSEDDAVIDGVHSAERYRYRCSAAMPCPPASDHCELETSRQKKKTGAIH